MLQQLALVGYVLLSHSSLLTHAAGITWDEWIDSAGDRAAKAARAKAAAEKAAAEEAEKQRQAAMLQQDKDRGYKRAAGERVILFKCGE